MRKLIMLLSAGCLVALAFVATSVYLASPGPASQEIFGVGIGDYHTDAGIVYLSGRRLVCAQTEAAESFPSVCTVDIAGKTLEIRARRNPPTDPQQLAGTCEASYNGKEWPCSIGSRHVDVPWFAFIPDPLGLDKAQIEALRNEFFVENLPEEAFTVGMLVIPAMAAILALLATGVWLWPRVRRKASYVLLVAASGAITLTITFLLSLLLTRGFWD
jgi:hypothetical protein